MHEYTYIISATLHKHTLLSEDFTPFVVVSLTCKKECQNFHSKYGVLMDSTLLPTNWSELYTKFLTVFSGMLGILVCIGMHKHALALAGHEVEWNNYMHHTAIQSSHLNMAIYSFLVKYPA